MDFSRFDKMQGTGSKKMLDQAFKNMKHLAEKKNEKSGKNHPIVESDSKIDITNYINEQYTGSVYMGSAQEALDVIYDTGSDWLTVDTDLCSNCASLDSTYFNTASSSTYTVVDGDTADGENDIDYIEMNQYYKGVN